MNAARHPALCAAAVLRVALCLPAASCCSAQPRSPGAASAAAAARRFMRRSRRTCSQFDPASDEVVGELQVTKVEGEDTLSDIARRFNLGYEEIVRANPGVDPWLPGVGREIVLPTQFVLPDAPREGLVINLAQLRVFYYPKAKEGELQTVITHPIGIGKVGWSDARRHDQGDRQAQEPDLVPAGLGAQGAQGSTAIRCPAKVPPGPGQSARRAHDDARLAELSDSRHEQALWRRACARATAASASIPKTSRELYDDDSGRHEGHGRQSAVRVRLARRCAVRAGVPGARGRSSASIRRPPTRC